MTIQDGSSEVVFRAAAAGMEQMKRMKSGVAMAGCAGSALVVLFIALLSAYFGTSSPWAFILPPLAALLLIAANTSKNEAMCMNLNLVFFALSLALPFIPIVIPLYFIQLRPAPELGTILGVTVQAAMGVPWNAIYVVGNALMVIAGGYSFKIALLLKVNQVEQMKAGGKVGVDELARKYRCSASRVMARLSSWNGMNLFEDGGFYMDPDSKAFEFRYTSLAKPAMAARVEPSSEVAARDASSAVFVGRTWRGIVTSEMAERERQRQVEAERERQEKLVGTKPDGTEVASARMAPAPVPGPMASTTPAMACSKCHFVFPAGKPMKFCPMCAAKQPGWSCEKCGYVFPTDVAASFCPMCGAGRDNA